MEEPKIKVDILVITSPRGEDVHMSILLNMHVGFENKADGEIFNKLVHGTFSSYSSRTFEEIAGEKLAMLTRAAAGMSYEVEKPTWHRIKIDDMWAAYHFIRLTGWGPCGGDPK